MSAVAFTGTDFAAGCAGATRKCCSGVFGCVCGCLVRTCDLCGECAGDTCECLGLFRWPVLFVHVHVRVFLCLASCLLLRRKSVETVMGRRSVSINIAIVEYVTRTNQIVKLPRLYI